MVINISCGIYTDRCRIGTGPQNEWYFFSHKDKKYPTGTRTNRATTAGFWKATGRDKAIFLANACRIGMRKTLVFYVGRAPHGKKTDWIMHEYRLDQDNVDVQVYIYIYIYIYLTSAKTICNIKFTIYILSIHEMPKSCMISRLMSTGTPSVQIYKYF
jgi:hypothetical protein